MLERIVASGLHVQVIVALVGATLLWFYIKLIGRSRWFGVEHMNNKEWTDAHKWRVFFLVGIPGMVLMNLVEELVFRAPLILAFERWDRKAWPWIALSSIVFGFLHFIDNWYALLHAFGQSVKDDAGVEVNDNDERFRIAKEHAPVTRASRIWRGCATGCVGIGYAYIGITQQSLYWAVGAHFLFNIGLMTLFPILILLLLLIPYQLVRLSGELLIEKVYAFTRWYRRKRRQRYVKRQGINLLR